MKKTFRRHGQSRADVVYNVIVYSILSLFFVVFLYPMVYVLSASFTAPTDVVTGKMWLFPTRLSFVGYREIFQYKYFLTGYVNTILICIGGTALGLVVTFMAGYVLSIDNLFFKKPIMWLFTVTMFFGGGMIPTFMLVNNTLRLADNLLALILPSAVSVWNIILIRTYFIGSIPKELREAAELDGCGNVSYFIRVAMPLAVPIFAVIALYNVVGRWNSYFDALLYMKTPEKYPLQLVIRNLLAENKSSMDPGSGWADADYLMRVEAMKYGVIVLSMLPMLVLYPFVQKYFIKGILVGSLKG